MADSAVRQRRARERRRQIGAKPYEVWLDPRGQALISAVQQPGEALDALLLRGLEALKCVTSDVTSDVATSHGDEDLGAVLLAMVQALFPLDTPVYPRTLYGLTTFPLYLVNTVLERYGYVLHVTKSRVATRFVACLDKAGGTEPYGLFELRPTTAEED